MNSYPHETVEFLAVTVTVDGQSVTTGVKFAVTGTGERPTVWADPVTLDDKIGVMVEGMTPGYYKVWAQVTSSPEIPVINCGTLQIT